MKHLNFILAGLSLYMGVLCVCSADYRLLPVYGYVFQETQ